MQSLCGALFSIALLFETPFVVTAYDKPIDAAYRLRVTYDDIQTGLTGVDSYRTVLHVLLVDRTDSSHTWNIADLPFVGEVRFTVERADRGAVVLSKADPDYGIDEGSIKLFFDLRTKRLLKRIDFETSQDIAFADDVQAKRMLNVSDDGLASLRSRGVFNRAADGVEAPELFIRYPLPQTTYAQFVRARPAQAANGVEKNSAVFEERIGAYQIAEDRLWFGKAFYDSEGHSGVGGIGYVSNTGKYTFLRIPEVINWSVSCLLIEGDILWFCRDSEQEGATTPGGLFRYDLRTRRTRAVWPKMEDAIDRIAHVEGAIFLGTDHGLYVLKNGKRMRYRTEPDMNGQMVVIQQSLP